MINTYRGLNVSFMLRKRFPGGRVARLPKLPPNQRFQRFLTKFIWCLHKKQVRSAIRVPRLTTISVLCKLLCHSF